MSARLPVLLALLVLGVNHTGLSADAGAPSFAPETYGIDRYQQIWKRSPFIKETIQEPAASPLSSKYALVGIAWLNKVPVVFLLDKNETDGAKNRFMVSKAKPDVLHDIELLSVSMDKEPRKSTAVIKQGSEQASLDFDPSALQLTGPAAAAVPGSPPGGYMPPVGVVPPPPGSASVPPTPSGATGPFNPNAGQVNRSPVAPSRINLPVDQANPAANPITPPGQVPPTPTRRIIRPKSINVN